MLVEGQLLSGYGQKLGQEHSGKCYKSTGRDFSISESLIAARKNRKIREKNQKNFFFRFFPLLNHENTTIFKKYSSKFFDLLRKLL